MLIQLAEPKMLIPFTKRVIFLLWQAAGSPSGMGWFQNNPTASEEEVFEQAAGNRDYPCYREHREGQPVSIYMDYVFGRCLKTDLLYDEVKGTVELRPDTPRATYQNWWRRYKDSSEVFTAALRELGLSLKSAPLED